MFWKKKCFHCGGKEDVRSVILYANCFVGGFNSWKEHYHDKCLEECVCHPEDHSNDDLRTARAILTRLKTIKKERKELVESVKILCDGIVGG